MFLETAVFRISFLTLFVQAAYYVLFHRRYIQRRWFRIGRYGFLALLLFTQGHLWYYVIAGIDLWPYKTSGIHFIFYILSMAWLLTLVCLTPFAVWILIQEALEFARRRSIAGREFSGRKISRRELFKRSANLITMAAPVSGMASISSGLFLGSSEVVVTRHAMSLPNLHEDMKGLRLVQISDLHVGALIDARYLHYCADILAGLKAQLLVVTGDIIDLSNHHVPAAGRFFRGLAKAFPLGIHGVMGNHDFFDHGENFARMLKGGSLRLLRNEELLLGRGRGRLRLMGLEYPWPLRRGARGRMARRFFERAVHTAPEGEGLARIVLNHHPADFAWLREQDADLVLSGHTHGGQVALTHARESPLSPISLMYRYYDGIYREGGSVLHVNRGLGHSIPLRINRPPEITLFELT